MDELRPIKFRGFNKKRGEWLYGSYVLNRGAHFIAPDEFADGRTWEDYEVTLESIGQYTGLVDNKGREIFEGDIIGHEDSTYKGVIEWHQNGYFFINDSWGKEYSRLSSYRPLGYMLGKYDFKIIGNEFKNSELLKGGE